MWLCIRLNPRVSASRKFPSKIRWVPNVLTGAGYYTRRERFFKENISEKSIPAPIPTWGILALLVNALQALGLARLVVGKPLPTSLGCPQSRARSRVRSSNLGKARPPSGLAPRYGFTRRTSSLAKRNKFVSLLEKVFSSTPRFDTSRGIILKSISFASLYYLGDS